MSTNDSETPVHVSKNPFRHWKQDFLASLVVFLVALPLCMGIALASGAPVSAGLVTGIVGGLLVGSLAGSPLQVSGPAAGLTVVCGEVIRQHGMPGLGIAVLIGGVIQLIAGIFRLGQWFRAVSPAVIHGMLSGIGILILSSQIHVLVDDRPRENALKNIAAIPESFAKAAGFSAWESAPERVARIAMLRSINSLYDRQRSLQRNLDRILLKAQDDTTNAADTTLTLPPEFRNIQEQLQTELAATAAAATESSIISGGNPTANAAKENLSAAQAAMSSALESLTENSQGGAIDPDSLRRKLVAATNSMSILLSDLKRNDWAGKIGLLSVLIIFVWQFTAKGGLKLIPAPLLAIIAATSVAQLLHIPVLYVDVPNNLLEGLSFPSMSSLSSISIHDVMVAGLVLAIIASAETLLCATAVDQMHSGPRTRYDKELCAQGLGNIVCGSLGALPMTGVIVRSAANVQAGGRTRLSAILHGLWLVLFTWALTPLLRLIPTSALAGILVYTGFRLIDIKGFRHLWHTNRTEAMIFLITVLVIVVEDLLVGVVTGIVLSSLKLLFQFSRLDVVSTVQPGRAAADQKVSMALQGAATFLRLPILAARLEKVPAGAELHIDLSELDYIDHACLELLMNWAKQHAATGGQLVMDWDSLHARFRSGGQRRPSNRSESGVC